MLKIVTEIGFLKRDEEKLDRLIKDYRHAKKLLEEYLLLEDFGMRATLMDSETHKVVSGN